VTVEIEARLKGLRVERSSLKQTWPSEFECDGGESPAEAGGLRVQLT
jgi:hypothetical protein